MKTTTPILFTLGLTLLTRTFALALPGQPTPPATPTTLIAANPRPRLLPRELHSRVNTGTSTDTSSRGTSTVTFKAKRIICEVDVPGEYPEAETKALGVRSDLGDDGGPCKDSDDEK